MEKDKALLNRLVSKAVSRRTFLAGAGTASAAAMLAGCSDTGTNIGTTATTTPLSIPDNDILNFALNLEYLEAEFYLYAATGKGLSAADALASAGTTTVPSGIAAVNFGSAVLQQYAVEIAQDELNHVRFLQAAIVANSGVPVARPNIDLTFFGPLAVAAGITPTATFSPFTGGILPFLVGAFIFEDVGVTAYSGAAPSITNTNILSAAAGIQAVEAYHAAEIRTLLVSMAAASNDQTYVGIANKVEALRATLGGGNETTLSISSIVAADTTNAIAFKRTTDQVLHIVYGAAGGAGLAKGGFFPNGLNGNIKTTAS